MSTVGVRELKNRLTYYLRQAKKGQEVVVTERDKPIALIQKIEAVQEPASLDAKLAKMAAEGLITLPTSKPLKRIRRVKLKGGQTIARTVIEGRRERF